MDMDRCGDNDDIIVRCLDISRGPFLSDTVDINIVLQDPAHGIITGWVQPLFFSSTKRKCDVPLLSLQFHFFLNKRGEGDPGGISFQ
jgi:hypothetical protein